MERVPGVMIGLGANVGDARSTLTHAVAALGRLEGVCVAGVSSLYETKPVGVTDQPDFLNAAVDLAVEARGDPATSAIELLVQLKGLEQGFGRERRGRWGPRELDLDLLLFDGHRLSVERPPEAVPASAAIDPGAATRLLEVPHPQMRERLFVLAPAAELAGELVPPGWDETIEAARRRRVGAEGPDAVRIVGSWSPEDGTWLSPSGGPIEIERASLDQAAAIARAHTAAAEASYRGYGPPDPDGLARRTRVWNDILGNPQHRAFVARDDGRIVGIMSVGQFRDEAGLGALHVLYVMPPWWGSGAGQQLLDLAHRELARDFEVAQLTVLAANDRARRFYERNGWVEGETLTEPHFGDVPTEVTRYRRRVR